MKAVVALALIVLLVVLAGFMPDAVDRVIELLVVLGRPNN